MCIRDREKVEKVYQAQKALIKENAAWDFIDMYEKTEGKENLYNTCLLYTSPNALLGYGALCVRDSLPGLGSS